MYFKHDEVARLAQRVRVLDREQALLFEDLREARTKADYYSGDDCSQEEAEGYVQNARALVGALIGSRAIDEDH